MNLVSIEMHLEIEMIYKQIIIVTLINVLHRVLLLFHLVVRKKQILIIFPVHYFDISREMHKKELFY